MVNIKIWAVSATHWFAANTKEEALEEFEGLMQGIVLDTVKDTFKKLVPTKGKLSNRFGNVTVVECNGHEKVQVIPVGKPKVAEL